jgi:hypothetical protein
MEEARRIEESKGEVVFFDIPLVPAGQAGEPNKIRMILHTPETDEDKLANLREFEGVAPIPLDSESLSILRKQYPGTDFTGVITIEHNSKEYHRGTQFWIVIISALVMMISAPFCLLALWYYSSRYEE